jgi:hypothetical protein
MSVNMDREVADALWVELGREPMAEPTPEQLLAFLRRCPDAIGVEHCRRLLVASNEALYCWMADHQAELDYFRTALARARASA